MGYLHDGHVSLMHEARPGRARTSRPRCARPSPTI